MENYSVLSDYAGATIGRSTVRTRGRKVYIHYCDERCFAAGTWHDYAWYFNFGLQNRSLDHISIDVHVNCRSSEECSAGAFLLFGSSDPRGPFKPKSYQKSDGYRRYYFSVQLAPQETAYLSNSSPRDYDGFIGSLIQKASAASVVRRTVGWTAENRAIEAFEFGDLRNGKPNIIYTSGFHPPEGDTYAVEAIFDHLTNPAGQKWLEYFNVILIPAVNPDGFIRGTGGSNARGVNLYWNFNYTDSRSAPEAFWLWRYLDEVRPILYVDFHCYVTQFNKRMAPYIKPARLYSNSEVRKVVRAMDNFLVSIAGGACQRGYLTYAKTTLAYLLTRHFNTITYTKFHFHLRDGIETIQRQAVTIFQGLCGILHSHGMHSAQNVLIEPAGKVRRTPMEYLQMYFLVAREEIKTPFRMIKALL